MSPSAVKRFLTIMAGIIIDEVGHGEEVNIHGLGKFYMHKFKGRIGVNPRNLAEKIVIAPRNSPKFTAGSKFRQIVKVINSK